MAWSQGYIDFIEKRLAITNKDGKVVPFLLNSIQSKYASEQAENKTVILKARQQGFSSLILGRFTADFLLKENTYTVIVTDDESNSEAMLDRVKFYIQAYESITSKKSGNQIKIPLTYNSKSDLYFKEKNNRITIGTAQNTHFGRSRTITNLHLSEAAFYPNLDHILAGAGSAVIPTGYTVIETTANGFNQFKDFWDRSENGETGFKSLFYKASDFYSPEYLAERKGELGRLFMQEYPESPYEAFLTSGDMYFESDALDWYKQGEKEPINGNMLAYV